MPEQVAIPVSDLLLDQANARFKEEQPTQQAAARALAKQEGGHLIKLAEDIVSFGLDPSTLPCVLATSDQKKRYRVLEGNRRILAIKALDTPALVAPVLDGPNQKRLTTLAARYATAPIEDVPCVLFDDEADAVHWIELRHTGMNEGSGLVTWGSDEKNRYLNRHGKEIRSDAGQVMDFVEKHGTLSEKAQNGTGEIATSIRRLLSNPEVRDAIGVELIGGQVLSQYPANEVIKGLTHIVEQLRSGELPVGKIYSAADRKAYAKALPAEARPDRETRLQQPVALAELSASTPVKKRPVRRPRRPPPTVRGTLIPKSCQLNVTPPRANALYNELLTLSLETYPNLSAIGLRVFLELSVDHYLEAGKIMMEQERRSSPLAKRLKTAAAHLRSANLIPQALETVMQSVADGSKLLAASTLTFNQYVHNPFIHPKAVDLRAAWDELQPFLEQLWP